MINFLILKGVIPLLIAVIYLKPLGKRPDYASIQPSNEDILSAIARYAKIINSSIIRRNVFVLLSLVGIVAELILVGYRFTAILQETGLLLDNYLFWILAANSVTWILYLMAGLSSVFTMITQDHAKLTDDWNSGLSTFKAQFSSMLVIVPFLVADVAHSVISQSLEITALDWKVACAQPILALVITLIFKLSFNEARFIKRLLLRDNSSKELSSSWYSQLTFSYADDLVAIGTEKTLDVEDLDGLISEDKSEAIIQEFNKLRREDQSLMRNIFRLVQKEFIMQQISTLISSCSIIAGPVLLKLTLDYLADPTTVSHPIVPYFYAILMFLMTMVRSLSDGQTYFLGRRIGLRVKTVLITLIYTKSLKRIAPKTKIMSELPAEDSNPGKITNLMSVDAAKILDVCCYLMYIWSTPLQTIICVIFLIYIAGLPGLAGVMVMLVSIPLAAWLMSALQKLRKKLMNSTDIRINAVNEMLQSIRIVKFFAWENRFLEKLGLLRENELNDLWNYVFSQAFYRIIWTATPVLVSFFTFLTFSLFSERELTISTAFTCLALFDQLRRPLLIIPDIVVNVLEAWVSYKRIRKYVESPELEDYINTTTTSVHKNDTSVVRFIPNSKFTWNSDPAAEEHGQHKSFTLSSVGISFPKGGLSIIYGSTGSGKSSLLSAILGDLNKLDGGVVLYGGKCKKTTIAYASQQGKC
jgi:ABC-type multidrug transport system fused ATPase/permease subunit